MSLYTQQIGLNSSERKENPEFSYTLLMEVTYKTFLSLFTKIIGTHLSLYINNMALCDRYKNALITLFLIAQHKSNTNVLSIIEQIDNFVYQISEYYTAGASKLFLKKEWEGSDKEGVLQLGRN